MQSEDPNCDTYRARRGGARRWLVFRLELACRPRPHDVHRFAPALPRDVRARHLRNAYRQEGHSAIQRRTPKGDTMITSLRARIAIAAIATSFGALTVAGIASAQ